MLDLVGRTLGPYQILAEIGHGGMANVYRASQPSVGREVAIKVLPVHFLQDRTFQTRFSREINVIARLQHPRILPVYDSGDDDGVPYIVMAYVPGGTLAERIKGHPGGLKIDEVIRMTRQIAEGLDYAHEQGIIHRDLKPSNILIDRKDNLYLADFGIAWVTTDVAQSTGSGMVGTPHYMAPELSYGGEITPKIDVYALGVTLFEMLTGKRPYEGDTPISIVLAHSTRPIPDVTKIRPRIQSSIQQVVAWALAKDPADRPETAGEVAQLLERAITLAGPDTAVIARPDIARTRIRVGQPVPVEPYPEAAETDIDATTPVDLALQAQRKKVEATASPTIKLPAVFPAVSLVGAGVIIAVTAILGLIALLVTGANGPASAENGVPATTMPGIKTRIAANGDWQIVTRAFDGVDMVQVPPGCFVMGNDSGDNEKPTQLQCFDQPFWIDKFEVTNAQFARLGGVAITLSRWTDDDLPRERITWVEARAFCEKRGARLPTELEWEYAARGPDELIFPWGDEFDAANVVFGNNSEGQTVKVGSRPGGVSWIGALDMSGNVYEWTSSTFKPYPYKANDGREDPEDMIHTRVARGGSYSVTARTPLNTTLRSGGDPASSRDDFGFRCARGE